MTTEANEPANVPATIKPTIQYDDFAKLDFRVGHNYFC
jgi:hypothetical protein